MSATGPLLRRVGPIALLGLAVTSCASPPLTLYALEAPVAGTAGLQEPVAFRAAPTVIEVARVTLPDYLDTQDILVRRGSVLDSSHIGRWATRLSLGATEFLAARLSRARPGALVTEQPQTSTPTYRLLVNISRLDIAAGATSSATGTGTLEADWLIIPGEPARPTLRDRVRLVAAGPVGSDQDVVSLETLLLSRLADAIDIARLR